MVQFEWEKNCFFFLSKRFFSYFAAKSECIVASALLGAGTTLHCVAPAPPDALIGVPSLREHISLTEIRSTGLYTHAMNRALCVCMCVETYWRVLRVRQDTVFKKRGLQNPRGHRLPLRRAGRTTTRLLPGCIHTRAQAPVSSRDQLNLSITSLQPCLKGQGHVLLLASS